MNGLRIPGTPLVVDYWRLRDVPPRALFFLTHMHADHTSGLSSTWPYPIHCTPLTGRLLQKKFHISPRMIVELEVGESRSLNVDCPGERVSVSVTTLDANHCPGSAMFLFEGYFGRILYTGDFRYSPLMDSLPALKHCSPVDVLYLDNTYCDPSCKFPSREVAADMIVQAVRANSELTTLIGLNTLGKEDLLVTIATKLGVWVGVSQDRYSTLKVLEVGNVFTTDMESCSVRVLPFHVVLRSALSDHSPGDPVVLGILPTCLFTGRGAPPPPDNPLVKVIPYSDHSSFDELMQFVALVHPCSVRPIVKSFSGSKSSITSSRCDMSVFNHLLDPSPTVQYSVPDGVQQLLSMRSPGAKPHPLGPSPLPLIKSTPTGNRVRRRAATGVCYLSPIKSTTSFTQSDESGAVTEIQVVEGEAVVVEDKENGCGGDDNCAAGNSGAGSGSVKVPLLPESPLRGTKSSARCVATEAPPPVMVTPRPSVCISLSPVVRPASASRTNCFYGVTPHRPWPARRTVRSVVCREGGAGGKGDSSPAVENQEETEEVWPVKTAPGDKKEGRRRERKREAEKKLGKKGHECAGSDAMESSSVPLEGGLKRKATGRGKCGATWPPPPPGAHPQTFGALGKADPQSSLHADLVKLVSEMPPELPNVSSSPTPLSPTSHDCHMTTGIRSRDITCSCCHPDLTHMPLDQAIDIIIGVS